MTQKIDIQTLLDWYEQMLTIRYFEDNAINTFRKGIIGGTTHPCIGQEAIAVGVAAALRPTDQMFATYRGHGHAIAKGLDINSLMAEICCKESGCSGGRGGSMHLCDIDKDFWGTNAIVAGHIPIAAGMALSNQLRKNDRVTAVSFGDGATCEGAFFETLNMATLWKVPLIFICENNGYAISVPTKMAIPIENIADRALGFGLPGVIVDGNDPEAVRDVVAEATERARRGEGPTLIECKTTRWERHSAISAGKYESEEEATKWKRVDPIPRLATRLKEMGASEEQLEEIQQRTLQANADALEFALNSADPRPETVSDFVYA
jgi:TPP-dependent pyruvate/acetoin dehydrogenase alpha subunit